MQTPGERSLPQQRLTGDSVAAERLLRAEGGSGGLSRLTDLAARLLSVPGSVVTVHVSVLTDVQTGGGVGRGGAAGGGLAQRGAGQLVHGDGG